MSASFKYSPDTQPKQQLFTDVQNLNGFSSEQLLQFVDTTVAFLAQKEDSHARLTRFAEEHKVNAKALENTVRGILFFFSESLKRNLKPEEVSSDLIALGLAEDKAGLLSGVWKSHFVSLSAAMVDATLKVNELVDMSWKFGVTAGTSEVSEAGTCFLQIKFVINKGGKNETVEMEMSLPKFYSFLSNMQKAAAQLEKI